MNGQITVGFDGSPQSLAAAQWAAHEAEIRGKPLELLQAWPWATPHLLGTSDAVAEIRDRLTHAESELQALLPGIGVTAVQMPTTAEDALVAAARHSTMLVLGSRGLTPLRGFLVGSVSQHVLAQAACPVVLVRAPASASPATDEIVLGLDLRHPCDQVIDFAFEAAALRGMTLRVIHAWQPPTASEYMGFAAIPNMDDELAADERHRLTDVIAPWREKYPGVEVATRLLRGSSATTLVETAGRPHLLVVGRRNRHSPLGPHVGHVAHAAVHHVHSPVAVVPYE